MARRITYRNPGNSPNSRWPCRDASALDGIVVVVFINSKGKINIFCLKVLNLKGKTQFLSNYFLRVAKVPAKINDAKGNPSPAYSSFQLETRDPDFYRDSSRKPRGSRAARELSESRKLGMRKGLSSTGLLAGENISDAHACIFHIVSILISVYSKSLFLAGR